MADLKISALTSATTPLAGTEVVPIVQSSTTKKVAISDLTAGRGVTMSTASVGTTISQKALTVAFEQMFYNTAGDGAANTVLGKISAQVRNYGGASAYSFADIVWANDPTTWYKGELRFATNGSDGTGTSPTTRMTIGNAGDITVNTGNLVIGTSGKGIDFAATSHPAGMTSELLADYEEGTWTPSQGVGLTIVGAFSSSGTYTKVGRQVTVNGAVGGATSVSCTSGGVLTSNLPFTTSGAFAGSCGIGNVNQGSTNIAFNTTLYCSTALTPNAGINFTVTYFV